MNHKAHGEQKAVQHDCPAHQKLIVPLCLPEPVFAMPSTPKGRSRFLVRVRVRLRVGLGSGLGSGLGLGLGLRLG